jgi:AcrR family transcriptional regulator
MARRVPLTAEAIVAATIAVADRDGFEAASMRRIARELGVEAMSLYHHVGNREHLLDLVVDAMFARFYTPVVGGPWREELTRRHHSARAVLLDHPWVIPLMSSRSSPGPDTVAHLDAVIGCLRASGFSLVLTAHAFALIDAHLYGFVAEQAAVPVAQPGDVRAIADGLAASGMMEAAPHLAELVVGHALQPGYDYAKEFDWGLGRILDILEADLRVETQARAEG